ncbi:MAG: lipid-binding SYLF domain-containing protein [Pseudomonadota bacterium]
MSSLLGHCEENRVVTVSGSLRWPNDVRSPSLCQHKRPENWPNKENSSMSLFNRRSVFGLAALLFATLVSQQSFAQTGVDLNEKSRLALDQLLRSSPEASALNARARAILVFPSIAKGGFIVGGEYGEGTLFMGGRPAGFYSIGAASFGLQIGAQSYSQALFFMTEDALNHLHDSNGFELGADIGFAVGSKGVAGGINTTTGTQPVVAFAFGQQGLMAGVVLQGAKITPIQR